eukprot:4985695-Amphidinium_carterae.1
MWAWLTNFAAVRLSPMDALCAMRQQSWCGFVSALALRLQDLLYSSCNATCCFYPCPLSP